MNAVGRVAQVQATADLHGSKLWAEPGVSIVFADTDGVADPELSAANFDDILFYLSHLAAPPRAGSTSPEVVEGEQIFSDVGCAHCHTPSLEGSEGPVPLYSDLLLHDVLPNDFRGMGEDGADVGIYRTPPLWGIRRSAPYFHDGRAETIRDAILLHTGEAEQVMVDYDALSAAAKKALDAFLADL